MKTLKLSLATCIMVLSLNACTADTHARGNIVSDTKIAQIKPNITSQYDVTRIFGPPTLVSPFAQTQTWYYAGQTTEQMGIFKKEVTDQKIVRIDFDDTGLVTKVAHVDPNAAQDVDFVDRQTPTAGRDFTILQQLVGNMGRYNGIAPSGNK